MKLANKISYIAIASFLLVNLTGCKFGPNFKNPNTKTNAHYLNDSVQTDSTVNVAWWEMFNDPMLDTLIKVGLDSNKDVLIAAARIEEYKATLGLKKADTWPAFNYQGNGTYGTYSGFVSESPTFNSFGGVGVNWEIDFWGKYRRASEGARADLLGSEFSKRSVQISLISQISASYYTILDYQWRADIAISTIQLRQENVNIINQKFKAGLVPEIDLNNAQLQLAIAMAALPSYERLIAFEQTKMSVLLGTNPRKIMVGDSLSIQELPPTIPSGLPSSLLLRRPDIGESKAQYHSQMAQIGVAQAMRFPSIGLTGLLGGASGQLLSTTVEGLAWNAATSITGPIFQFGKNKRRVEIEQARTESAKRSYEKTVITAFKEVEDALISVSTYSRELAARELQTTSALNAQKLAQLRYDKGVTSYLEVITLQGYAFDAELSLAGTRRQLFESYINLYKALGGGWISEEEKKTAEQNSQQPNELPETMKEK
jgi:multidrug efflux system outer membrane protein